MLQAQQYAAAEGDIVRYTAYNDLAAQNKTKITDTDFFKEISVGTESDYTDTIKQKVVTVKIYKGSDVLPCYKLEVPRLSADVNGKGVPIGTVITWASNNPPTENGTWLECNGQSCVAYPELVKVLGKNTVPDYRERFLESNTVAGMVKEAGLPNITGKLSAYSNYYFLSSGCAHEYNPTSALYSYTLKQTSTKPNGYTAGVDYADQYPLVGYPYLGLNASYSNPIYGNSDTVQPASVTVRRFIRAA